jgi:hypothetical protein
MFGAKPFLTDLEKNSYALDMINDDFRHYADELRLVSFYEMLKLNIGMQSALIVEKDSAYIGLRHERIQPLNADHRTICKFGSADDPNYIKAITAIASIVEDVLSKTSTKKDREQRLQLSTLQTYLDMTDKPVDDLSNEKDGQTKGSCTWIEEREGFQSWLEPAVPAVPLYWIYAPPATGKTVLAAHIISHIQGLHRDCSYYFFRHGQQDGNGLSAM